MIRTVFIFLVVTFAAPGAASVLCVQEELAALGPTREMQLARIALFGDAAELFVLRGDHAAALSAWTGAAYVKSVLPAPKGRGPVDYD